ncbi:MAG: hypothetical protein AAGN15_26970 [Cyanobacteria bacterium J06581_3]
MTAIDTNRSDITLINIRDECTLSNSSTASADEFVQTLLSEAVATAAQTEEHHQSARAFERIGESYACLGQNEQADSALQQAIAAAEQIDGDYAQNYRAGVLKDVASVYGRSINDTEKMNAVLAGLLAAVETPYPYVRGGSYSLVKTAARLYSETGQYQKLRELMDQTDGDEYRLDLITEVVPTLRRVESVETQAAIATLFPEFDLDDLYSSVPSDAEIEASRSAPPRGYTPSILYAYSFYRYNPKEIESYSPAAIAELVNEESSIIEQLEGGEFEQINGYKYLGDFLARVKQPEAALAVFEIMLAQAAESVEAGTDPDVGAAAAALARLREDVRVPTAYALLQLGSVEPAMQTLIGLDDESSLSIRDQISPALRFAQSESLSLSTEQRLDVISGAEALLLQREDEEKTQLLLDVANAYAEIGAMAEARQLLPMIVEAMPANSELATNARSTGLAGSYSNLLVMTGDYEGAIAFIKNIDANSLNIRFPAQFVAAGQYEQAEALLQEITLLKDYFTAAEYMIAEYESADEGYAFTVRVLEKIETADLITDESYQEWRDRYPGDRFPIYTENDRSHISHSLINEYTLSLDPDVDELRHEFMTPEQKATIQKLIDALNNNWLQVQIIQRFFSVEEALRIIDSDAELSALDDLLLRRVVQLVEANEFEQAVEVTERVRSPYIQSRALTHIANGYLSPSDEVSE